MKVSEPGREAPVIRMFGITANSNSVAMHVHNFTPYFYVKLSQQAPLLGPDDLLAIRDQLNKWIQGSQEAANSTPVKAVEIIRDKASVMNYQKDKATFLKIYTGLPKYVN